MKKGLLIGAGFSYDLGMPLVSEFTPIFLGLFNDRELEKLQSNFSKQQPYGSDRPINVNAIQKGLELLRCARDNASNYEQVIAQFKKSKGIERPTQSDRDSYNYLFQFLYSIVHGLFCMYQRASYEILYPVNRVWFSELENLLSDKETWVFSLNHDLYIESLALDLGIPITYGDTSSLRFPITNLDMQTQIEFSTSEAAQLLSNRAFLNQSRGINLVKLHGGISELNYQDKKLSCNLQLNKPSSKELMEEFFLTRKMAYYHNGVRAPGIDPDRTVTNMDGELDILTTSLLTGDAKFSKTSNPKLGEEKLQLFEKVLNELDELTVIGYGFGDKHINVRISNALLLNPNLSVQIVNPADEFLRAPECIEQFDYGQRIKYAKCGAAHWMHYSKHRSWDNEQMKALDAGEAFRGTIKNRVYELMQSGWF